MNDFKLNSKAKLSALILGICFVTYNVVLFAVSGFAFHGGAFWISYAFTILAFIVLAMTGYLLRGKFSNAQDMILHLPIVKHCKMYVIAQFVISVAFMLLDLVRCPWWIAFAVQTVLLSVHLIFVISCFMAKDTITQVQTNVRDKTAFIKLLQVDASLIASEAKDEAVKEAYTKFAENIRFSDPMSSEALFELEKEIQLLVNTASKSVKDGDYAQALELCEQAELKLEERNKKTKALK